jgi:heat shock protein HslJ
MIRILTLILTTLTFLGLAACAAAGSSLELVGNYWILTELNGEAPVADTTISAEFTEEGRVSGSAGCNSYSTTYTEDGDNLTFAENIMTTMMACPEPTMMQETDYLKALGATATYQIEEDLLTFFDADGNEVAVFEALDQSLAGTSWDVLSYNNGMEAVTSVIIDTEISANFGEDGQITGNASCNNYFGPYETDPDEGTISIGPLAMTEMFCADPEGRMDQESQYLAALETAATYKIMGEIMEMRTSEGAIAATFKLASE